MGKLGDALRKKYKTPREALRALGLDEALLDVSRLAYDGANPMKATRFGAMTLSLTAAAISPLLAMDQKITLPKSLFIPLTTKNFKEHRTALLAGVRGAVDGKLRKGLALDASMSDFAKALDTFTDDVTTGVDEPAPEDKQGEMDKVAAVEPAKAIAEPGSTYDAEPMKAFMKQCGMDDASIAKCMDMMPKPALDSEESAEEKAEREKKETEEKAAKDAALAAKDAEMKDMVSKPAMDAALKAQADAFTKQIKTVRDSERGIRVAIAEVHPWTGDLPATMAFDSAADVYRHALVMRSIEGAKDLHADALLPILKTLPKNGARPGESVSHESGLAMDASAVTKAIKYAPGLENISTTL